MEGFVAGLELTGCGPGTSPRRMLLLRLIGECGGGRSTVGPDVQNLEIINNFFYTWTRNLVNGLFERYL